MALAVVALGVVPLVAVAHHPTEGTWEHAWAGGDAEELRTWFAAHTGPTQRLLGTMPGGDVRTQQDADRLIGKVVTSQLRVACSCVLRQFEVRGADLVIAAGDVTVADVRLDGQDTADLVGGLTVRGDARVVLSGVEITGHHDGIRAYARSITGQYVYIHDVSSRNPYDFHEDGIQTMGGVSDFSRSFVDMTGANTSAVMVKADSAPIRSVRINTSVLMGGGYTIHVHDGPFGPPGRVDLSHNAVAAGYHYGLVSTWDLTDPDDTVLPVDAAVLDSWRRVRLVDGARI